MRETVLAVPGQFGKPFQRHVPIMLFHFLNISQCVVCVFGA